MDGDLKLERLDSVTRAFHVSGACGFSRPGTPTRTMDQLALTDRERSQGATQSPPVTILRAWSLAVQRAKCMADREPTRG